MIHKGFKMEKITQDWKLSMVATSPIIHGSDEKAGNMTFIRTMSMIDKNGDHQSIPVISGNSLRGQLRRIAARQFIDYVGVKTLPLDLYHMFFSGGAIQKGSSKIAFSVEDIKELRTLIPFFGLFGGAYKNDLFPSTLRVEWIIPVCKESEVITDIESNIQARELVDTVFYTRRDDKHEDVKIVGKNETSQMIYETEALVAGSKLLGEVGVYRASIVEVGCLAGALNEWIATPRLGGKSSVGNGKIKITDKPIVPHLDEYTSHLASNKDKIIEFLNTMGASNE